MNAVRLYERYSVEELTAMQQAIWEDPASRNPAHANGGSIRLYTKAAEKKLAAIAWAITYHIQDRRGEA
jgi:hypothetical protein